MGGVFANADIPGIDTVVEKAGAWGLVGLLMYWILNVLTKKMDALAGSIEKLADKLDDKK